MGDAGTGQYRQRYASSVVDLAALVASPGGSVAWAWAWALLLGVASDSSLHHVPGVLEEGDHGIPAEDSVP